MPTPTDDAWEPPRRTTIPLFPPHRLARADGLLAVGGDLSVPCLLAGYRHGAFPWYAEGDPILWWSPDPRLILEPEQLRVSRSLRALIRKGQYRVTFDRAFRAVIHACATAPRGDGPGTWIHPEVEAAYGRLHDLGYAHSVEAWEGDALVGGLYGLLLGRGFFGESMFALRTGASKVALVALAELLIAGSVSLIDCQVTSAHLQSLGAREVPRAEFLERLQAALAYPDLLGPWTSPSCWPTP